MLLGPRVFHILDPNNVEAVLSKNFEGRGIFPIYSFPYLESWWISLEYGFGLRRAAFYPLLGDGIFTQEGADWKHSRETLRKQFARIQYQNLDHFRGHVDNLLDCLPKQSGIVDLQPLFFNLTLDITTSLLLGKSVHSLKSETAKDVRAFQESFNVAQEGLAKRFRIAPWHLLYNPSSFRGACATVHQFVDNYIQEKDQNELEGTHQSSTYGFIDQLARNSKSSQSLRDQLLNILLAGRDTTACSLSWALYVLTWVAQNTITLTSTAVCLSDILESWSVYVTRYSQF